MSARKINSLDLGTNLEAAVESIEELRALSVLLQGATAMDASTAQSIGRLMEVPVGSIANLTDFLTHESTEQPGLPA